MATYKLKDVSRDILCRLETEYAVRAQRMDSVSSKSISKIFEPFPSNAFVAAYKPHNSSQAIDGDA